MGEILLKSSEDSGKRKQPRNDLLNNTDDDRKNRVNGGRKSEKLNA